MIRGLVFDLDDTLYPEREYVASGFRHVADLIATRTDLDEQELFAFLWRGFLGGRRGTAFNDLLDAVPAAAAFSVADLAEAYQSHRPSIELAPGVATALERLEARPCRLGLISDGPLRSQTAKLEALGLSDRFDPIVLTGAWPAEFGKPHPRAFEVLEESWDLTGSHLAYVADNPHKDFATPRRRGWRTVRVCRPGQLHFDAAAPEPDYAADRVCDSVTEACSLLVS